jgi:hypothetical protein
VLAVRPAKNNYLRRVYILGIKLFSQVQMAEPFTNVSAICILVSIRLTPSSNFTVVGDFAKLICNTLSMVEPKVVSLGAYTSREVENPVFVVLSYSTVRTCQLQVEEFLVLASTH